MAEGVFDDEPIGQSRAQPGGIVIEDAPPIGDAPPVTHRPLPRQQQQQQNPLGSIPQPAAGTKIKATFQTEYDPAQVASLQGQRPMARPPLQPFQSRYHVPQGRDVNAGEWLENNCSNPQYSDYYITVRRKSPANMAGLVISAERRIPLMRLSELVQTVQELCGGGSYCYDVYSVDHQPQLRGNFTIPQNDFPPKTPDTGFAGSHDAKTDAPEVAEKKKELEIKRLQKQIEEIDRKELREDERKRETEMGEAAEARKEMVQFMRESREETRRILEDSKKDSQGLMLQMMTMMKEVVGSLKQSDGGGSNVVAEAVKAQGEFLANSIKTQSENSSKFMEMMIGMNKSSKEETASAARVQSESQTKMVEMVVNNVKTMAEVSKGSGDKMQELFLGLLTKQMNHNPMKEVLDLMRQGEDRAAEKYEMVMEIMEKNRTVADPNADPFSNILAGVIDRFTRGGGGAGASGIAGGAQPANMTPEQISEFARAIAPVVQAHMQYQQQNPQSAAQAALPPPSQMPPAQQPGAPQNPPVIQTADLFGDGDMDGDGEDYPTIGAVPPQQQATPQQPPPQQQAAPQQQQAAPQQPQPATPPKSREEAILMSGGEEIYTRNVATQIIHMAIRDAQGKAQRASWVEAASVWLTDAMQKALADAADVPHKALVIQQKCDPAAFDALMAVTSAETYTVFCAGLSTLSEMIKAKQPS